MDTHVKCIQWGQGPIREIEIYSSLPSTNTLGKDRIKRGCRSGTVLWALCQTDGRGRRGRSWEGGKFALTFSLLWRCPPGANIGVLPLTLGLGLVQSLGFLVPGLKVKWPNDLYFGDGKLGGILVETVHRNGQLWAVLGVGINVQRHGPGRNGRISLEEITGFALARLGVLNLALQGVEKGLLLALSGEQDLSGLFRSYGNFLGRRITVFRGDRSWAAVAKEVLPDGRLLLDDGNELWAELPEEISVRF